MLSRIDTYIAIDNLRRQYLPREMVDYGRFSYAKVNQCDYWNKRVLDDCTAYGNNSSDTSPLQYVQESVLLDSKLCGADQLCVLPTSNTTQ